MSKKKNKFLISIIVFCASVVLFYFSNEGSKISNLSIISTPTPSLGKETQAVSPSPETLADNIYANTSTNVSSGPSEGEQKYQVVKVVDGDTFDINIEGQTERVRLIGIDTPETVDPRKSVQCFGKEASNKAKEILTNQFVVLEADLSQGDRDKYNRLLRYAFLPDGTNFGLYMISEGYAHEYTYKFPYKYQSEFKAAEISARENNKGLWSPNTCSGNK